MAMGGVGEAMLLGAAMGGGSAALTGGDPLKGALLGGLTGGAGAGISGALGGAGAAGTEAALATAGTELGTQAATQAVTPAATGIAGLPAAGTPTSFGAFGEPAMANSPAATMADPTGLAQAQLNLNAANTIPSTGGTFTQGMQRFASDPMASLKANQFTAAGAGLAGAIGGREEMKGPEEYDGPLKRFKFNPSTYRAAFAEGGIANLAAGGYDRMVGEDPMYMSNMASGGISDLGSYSDYARGGRMLKGPGDGMSDSIPASIDGKRPARLARDEFVVPTDVVSGLGNGSSDAGAKQLYAMMDRVRQARTGRKSQGREINPRQYMAA